MFSNCNTHTQPPDTTDFSILMRYASKFFFLVRIHAVSSCKHIPIQFATAQTPMAKSQHKWPRPHLGLSTVHSDIKADTDDSCLRGYTLHIALTWEA